MKSIGNKKPLNILADTGAFNVNLKEKQHDYSSIKF